MHRAIDFPRKIPVGVLWAALFAAACAEPAPTATVDPVAGSTPRASVTPTLTDIVVTTGSGVFNSPLTVNTSGWSTTEFWDNASDDAGDCNVGFYAIGTISAGCTNAQAGSYANRGGFTGGSYWGLPMGGTHVNPADFLFSGSYAYLVTLKGSYAGATSEVGWFTKDAEGYHRHPVAGWGAKLVGTAVLVPRGAAWGLYLKREGHPTQYDYSDATGDLHNPGTDPVQQFALFAKANAGAFLVGIEDNPEETVGIGDDDFNDYLLSVEPLGDLFVIGDEAAHGLNDVVNFWGAQWWKNNAVSGEVSRGVASFKGYATDSGLECGDTWRSMPGNSANPPAMIPARVLVIVTNTVLKSGPAISGTIRELLIVDHDGGYGPNPGHAGNGPVTQLVCSASDG